ncbi:MAG TPA: hypothetical protein VFC79_05635, partial [Tissierellaceae bacterium]|nr:hypothetical protein [Tissierellaceae bacterium]
TMGMTAKNAQTLALNTNQLSLDMGALFNVPYQQITEDLRSGLIGQSRTLYKYGIDTTEAAIANEALAQGIEKSVRHMSQGEKMMLRHNVIIKQMSKVQGDFAETFNQPINQIRVFQERIVTLSRTIGNLFTPLMSKIIIMGNAIIIVLTRVVNAIGRLFGINMESKVSNVANSFAPLEDDIEGGMDSLNKGLGSGNKKAKELKKHLAGFDELNILNMNKDTGVGSVGSGGGLGGLIGGSPLDLDLGQYDAGIDNIRDKAMEMADKIMDKIKPFGLWLKDNFKDIAETVAIIGGVMIGWKLAKDVMKVFDLLTGAGGKGGVGSLENLVIGITMAIVGVKLGSSGLSEIISGNASMGEIIKTAVGMAMGLGSGLVILGVTPAGWALGASVVLTTTLIGIRMGYDKSLKNLVNKTVSDNGGVLISELANGFSKLMKGIQLDFNPVIKSSDKIASLKTNIDEGKKSINALFDVITSKSGDSKDAMERLHNTMSKLLDETWLLRNEAYDNIIYALSNSFTDVEESVGKSSKEIIKNILLIKNDGDKKLTDAQMKIKEYYEEWEKTGDFETAIKKIQKEYDKIYKGSNKTLDGVTKSYEDMIKDITNIDWENPAKRAKALELIGQTAKDTENEATKYLESIEDSVDLMLTDISDPTKKKQMKEAMTLFGAGEKNEVQRIINGNMGELFSAMNRDILQSIGKTSKEASDEWDKMNPVQRFFAGGSKDQHVYNAIQNYKKNFSDPIIKELKENFGELGVKSGNDLNKAIDDVIKRGFEIDPYYGAATLTKDLNRVVNSWMINTQNTFNKKALTIKAKLQITNPNLYIPGSGGRSGNVYYGKMQALSYADGGFPVPGELFIANEPGNPELIGSIGGRSAVVNNTDIVASVSRGVYQAVKSAMGSGGGGSPIQIIVKVGEDTLVDRIIGGINRQSMVNGRIVINV